MLAPGRDGWRDNAHPHSSFPLIVFARFVSGGGYPALVLGKKRLLRGLRGGSGRGERPPRILSVGVCVVEWRPQRAGKVGSAVRGLISGVHVWGYRVPPSSRRSGTNISLSWLAGSSYETRRTKPIPKP